MKVTELKDGVSAVARYLSEHGIDVPHTRLLEAVSRGLGQRNWATLRARLNADSASHTKENASAVQGATPVWEPSHGPMSSQEYVRCGGNRCPSCGSFDITAHDIEADGPAATEDTTCNHCKATWDTHYSVQGYSRLVPGAVQFDTDKADASPFGSKDVLAFVYLDGAVLRHRGLVYSANAAWACLSKHFSDAPCGSAHELATFLYANSARCIDLLVDGQVDRLRIEDSDSAELTWTRLAKFVRECPGERRLLAPVRQDVVDDIIEHVRRTARKYSYSPSAQAFEVAEESSNVLGLEATLPELIEAARRLR